jgi:hypothetical protein
MELPVPLEIPWKLAASNQPLVPDGPKPSTIALYFFQPKMEALDLDYPDEYLVYLKFTVTICPFDSPWENRIKALLTGGLPVWSFLFELTVTPNPMQSGGFRPFFLAAAPLRRTMIETGIVGAELFEGEANGVAVGKSASQLHETGSSHGDTSTSGWAGSTSWPLGTLGFNTQDTSTSASFDRTVTQRVDTTQRDASQERRELLSHRTNVENMLSLLDAKHLGSPYLRFMMRPRPLRPLTVDPSDPNLWYSQLLARRSSGLEGIQEFFAVIAVPRPTNFCIAARAMRIGVFDAPPRPPRPSDFGAPRIDDPTSVARMENYLRTLYPPGTPLEELDIDIMPPAEAPNLPRPAITHWNVSGTRPTVVAIVESPRPAPDWSNRTMRVFAYKHRYEVWRDTVQWEYERNLARSPLERGMPFAMHDHLSTCFVRDASGDLRVKNYVARAAGPSEAGVASAESADAGNAILSRSATTRRDQVQRVVDWNAAEQRMVQQLRTQSLEQLEQRPLSGAHIVDFVLEQWAALQPDDKRNEPLDAAGAALGLSASTLQKLRKQGILDLRALAATIRHAAAIEGLNARQEQLALTLTKQELCAFEPTPTPAAMSAAEARSLRDGIAARLLVPAGGMPRRRRT